MVGRCYSYSIKFIACLVEHLAKITETLCLRIQVHYLLCMGSSHINITQSHNLHHTGTGKIPNNLFTTIANTYIGNLHLICYLSLRCKGGICQYITSTQCQSGRSHGHGLQKISSCCHYLIGINLVLIKEFYFNHLYTSIFFLRSRFLIP